MLGIPSETSRTDNHQTLETGLVTSMTGLDWKSAVGINSLHLFLRERELHLNDTRGAIFLQKSKQELLRLHFWLKHDKGIK